MANKVSSTTTPAEKWWGYLFALSIIGIVCVTLTIADSKDFPLTIVSAVLGVAMTVFATYFLFKGQSKQQLSMLQEQHAIESTQEKESEVFKEKLSTYNRFLDALRKYVTEATAANKKEVIFHAMALRMHTNAETAKMLDNHIVALLQKVRSGDIDEVKVLIESLNAIACIFHSELYGQQIDEAVNLSAFADVISGIQEDTSEDEKRQEAAEEEIEDTAAAQDSKVTSWDAKIIELKAKGWTLKPSEDSFTLTSISSPVLISVYRKKGKYVIEATKENDNVFSQGLKDCFKGSRRYGTWWRELPINNYGVTEGTLLAQIPTNDRARASVNKWIDKLTDYIK